MEHIKSLNEITKICKQYRIENWSLDSDGKIQVYGNVNLSNKGLTEIPLGFSYVSGSFWCDNNKLTSLEGCPERVDRHFSCYSNNLTSLEGCPEYVGGYFGCHYNQLTSLEGCPKEVGGNFNCSQNKITSLQGCPKKISGDFDCWRNLIKDLSIDHPIDVGGSILLSDNPLPTEILLLNNKEKRWLFKYVYEYPYLWRDGQLRQYWWNELKLSMDEEI